MDTSPIAVKLVEVLIPHIMAEVCRRRSEFVKVTDIATYTEACGRDVKNSLSGRQADHDYKGMKNAVKAVLDDFVSEVSIIATAEATANVSARMSVEIEQKIARVMNREKPAKASASHIGQLPRSVDTAADSGDEWEKNELPSIKMPIKGAGKKCKAPCTDPEVGLANNALWKIVSGKTDKAQRTALSKPLLNDDTKDDELWDNLAYNKFNTQSGAF
jgi:hypothetical protein